MAAGSGSRVPETEEVPTMEQQDDTPATMTVEDAGRLLGISRRAAYRAAAAGHLPVIRLGRRILVPTARLHQMLGIQPADSSSA